MFSEKARVENYVKQGRDRNDEFNHFGQSRCQEVQRLPHGAVVAGHVKQGEQEDDDEARGEGGGSRNPGEKRY